MEHPTEAGEIALYSSPISDCSARLRIALTLKDIPYQAIDVSLKTGQNLEAEYSALNPAKTVPTLVVSSKRHGSITLTQSIAALEYLDEAFPNSVQLLPTLSNPAARATVRSLVGIIATDIHPLTTHRVGSAILARFPCPQTVLASQTGNRDWDLHWINRGLELYEKMASQTAGRYSFESEITQADVCLLPELWTAERIGVDLKRFPTIFRVFQELSAIPKIASVRSDPASELK
ncbi:hypothetical protein NLG97_g3229 [Lecanicillium saksenae]|uniref:Uncharacterized protein n=1 Tax=Lecanicillium saksenae TaxID=468837 RepID=A0ACC1QZA4_9HYPO|nr:hypothetical protein NLG97_g3229 [Lecanicillium saksenae]